MKTLALDIGNVCVAIHPENFSRKLGFAAAPEILAMLYGDFEHGIITPEEFYCRALDFCPCKVTEKDFWEAFDAMVGEPVPGMTEFVRSLQSKGWRAVFFSDTSVRHLEAVRRIFPACDAVAGGVYSYVTGSSKPAEKMFAAFEAEWGVPDLYLDDRSVLIEAATQRGWHAEVFPGTEKICLP